jgi:hypothetical protein
MFDTRTLLERASDGCHRYGWLINIVTMLVMFAYFTGGMNKSIELMEKDIQALKSEVFELSHITRGLK